MKARPLFAGIALILSILACSLAPSNLITEPTPSVPTISDADVATVVAGTPLPEPTTEPTAAPTVESTPVPTATIPPAQVKLVLANSWASPGRGRVVDALSGETLASFEIPEVNEWPQIQTGGESVVYMNTTNTQIQQAGFDGSTQELTFLNPGGEFFDVVFLPSPDGTQIAWGEVGDFDANGGVIATLTTARMDGSNLNVLLSEKRAVPSRTQPWRWSNDGQSLFFANIPYGIGGYILFMGSLDLQKVDLTNHTVTPILPDRHCLCPTVISPDESQVAHIIRTETDQELHIFDISAQTDRSVKLPVGYQQAGAIVWAPDGSSLALTLAIGNSESEAYSIVRVDAASLALQVLLPNDDRLIQTAAWPVSEVIWAQDAEHNIYRMDPTNGSLTPSGTSEMIVHSSE